VFNLQGSEIIVILLLALVVLGPEKLPDAIRKFSQTYGELKKMGNGFQSELKSALDEPMREMRETADLVKKAADPARVVEDSENEARLRSEADAAMLAATPDIPVSDEALAISDPAGVNGPWPGGTCAARRGTAGPGVGAVDVTDRAACRRCRLLRPARTDR
jgi:sec-independent protein translocase protein TatB